MKAKKKPIDEEDPGRFRRRYRAAPDRRLKTAEPAAARPASRSARLPNSSTSSRTKPASFKTRQGGKQEWTLLVAEHAGGALNDATAKALTAAGSRRRRHIPGCRQGRPGRPPMRPPSSTGVAKVLVAESDLAEHQLAEPMADLIVGMAGDYDAIVAPATANGKNVLPRVAALLDVMQISDIIEVISTRTRSSARSMPATPSRR
jgi:hypothetical protein